MKKITFEFSVSTHYVGSKVTEQVELEFEDDATEQEIEDEVSEYWVEWRNNECEGGWTRIKEEVIADE